MSMSYSCTYRFIKTTFFKYELAYAIFVDVFQNPPVIFVHANLIRASEFFCIFCM